MDDAHKILVAEDEAGQAEVLRFSLEAEGYKVDVASDGRVALEKIKESPPDLLILDWMLPEVSGITIMKILRGEDATKKMPVIMLSARGEEDDKVRGFEVGVDDYMVKPYLPSELIARIKAVLRRSQPDMFENLLEYAGIAMNLEEKKVTRDGDLVALSSTEFRLLRVFMSRPGKVFSRSQLIDMAWGTGFYLEDRTVDVGVRRLRQALNEGGKPDLFRTVRSEGYSLESQ